MIVLVAEITKLDGEKIHLNYRNTLSMEVGIFDRQDLEMPQWGVISNSGSISFIDFDETIKGLAKSRQLKSGMLTEIKLKNTLTNYEKKIGDFVTNRWDYDIDNKKASVSLKDDLEQLQSISFPAIEYNYEGEPQNFQWLYGLLRDATIYNDRFSMKSFGELDTNTQERLSNLYLAYPFIYQDNLWASWNKFCVATQTHIYKGSDGIITCEYLGGN